MLIYSPERFIGAHTNRSIPYYNHSYDRIVRDTMCSACGMHIGEQLRYTDSKIEFRYDSTEKNHYKFCPYCGEKL